MAKWIISAIKLWLYFLKFEKIFYLAGKSKIIKHSRGMREGESIRGNLDSFAKK